MRKDIHSDQKRPGSTGSAQISGPAFQAAEQELIDQRLFNVSGDQAQSFLDLLERPADDSVGLRDLFSRPEPWETE